MAPDRFSLGETSDFLITEYKSLQREINGIRPPGNERGVHWLLLAEVIQFFPIRADDAYAFESDADKAQVVLGEAEFETYWEHWFKAQIVDQSCINGLALLRTLDLRSSSNIDASQLADWLALAERINAPSADLIEIRGFSANFLKNRDRLYNLVREDSDTGSFFVSCPIEWMNLQSDANILDSDAELAELAQRLHEKYWAEPFNPSLAGAEDLNEFAGMLCAKAPDAFPGEWTPATVSLYVRYGHRIRFDLAAPDDILAAVRSIDKPDTRRAAELLAFLLGVALGSNKTHGLERLLHPERFKVAKAHPSQQGNT